MAVEEQRQNARKKVGQGILDPGGLVRVSFVNTRDKQFSPPVAVDT